MISVINSNICELVTINYDQNYEHNGYHMQRLHRSVTQKLSALNPGPRINVIHVEFNEFFVLIPWSVVWFIFFLLHSNLDSVDQSGITVLLPHGKNQVAGRAMKPAFRNFCTRKKGRSSSVLSVVIRLGVCLIGWFGFRGECMQLWWNGVIWFVERCFILYFAFCFLSFGLLKFLVFSEWWGVWWGWGPGQREEWEFVGRLVCQRKIFQERFVQIVSVARRAFRSFVQN